MDMMQTRFCSICLFLILVITSSLSAYASTYVVNYPVVVASEFADMERGFFERLNMGPSVFKNSPATDVKTTQPRDPDQTDIKQGDSVVSKTVATSKKTEKPVPGNITSIEGNMVNMGIWQYFLMALVALVFTVILFLLLRLSRNAKVIETPNNLIEQIKAVVKEFDSQNKNIKDVKNRIQKTENTFLKVLSAHIDEKQTQLAKEIDLQFQDYAGANKALVQQYTAITSKINEIEGLMSTFKDFVADQKLELKKMQQGYDWSVINSMCMGLIGIIDKLDEDIENSNDENVKQSLYDARSLIAVMLETYNVSESSPEIGTEYSGNGESEKCQVTMIKSDKSKQKGTIARVIKPSFVYNGGSEEKKILRVAEIEVYQ